MKVRNIFLLFSLLLVSSNILSQKQLPGIAGAERIILFEEQFDNNSRSWIIDNSYLKGIISNGGYIIKCKNFHGTTALSCKTVDLDYSRDFEIEAAMRVLKGSGGMVFGMNNDFHHYRIEINEKRDLYFVKSDTKLKLEFKVTNCPAVRSDSLNKITLRKVNGILYLFANGILIRELNEIIPEGLQVGFNVGLNSELSTDYIKVSYLERKKDDLLAQKLKAQIIDSTINVRNDSDLVLTWTSPSSERINLQEYSAWAKGKVKTSSGIESVIFYVNGVPVGQSEFQIITGEANTYKIEKLINLKPGENSVYFLVTDGKKKSQRSDLRFFTNPVTTAPEFAWSYPSGSKSIVNSENLNIDAIIKSKTGLLAARIMVNGVPFEENPATLTPDPDGKVRIQRPVILRDGENSIYIAATNSAGTKYSEGRTVIFNRSLKEKRIALVIGNASYQNNVTLKNPINDANLMEGTLKSLDFKVIKGLNLGYNQMLDSLREFSRNLSLYNVALFYYAGHGIQVDGINYLIPVDAKLNDKNDCSWEALAMNKITDELNKHSTNTNIIILDACRNNPYRSWARGEVNGFKALGPVNGTIISFATSEGSTAADGNGLNGTFTETLVKQMIEPQQIENVFKNTRKIVKERTKDQQIPMEWNYLTEDFYFVKPDTK